MDVSNAFYNHWSTVNTAIATVNASALHHGAGVGSTTSNTHGYLTYTYARNCPAAQYFPSGGAYVYPTISGPNTVWYFSNLTVSGYATSIQLTSSGGSATTWNITAGASKINVSSFTGSSINVLSSGTSFSSSVGDVKLTATTNGQTSSPFSITTRTPNLAVPGTIPPPSCDGTYGYLITLNYTIRDQLNALLPSGVPVNENWTTGVVPDYNGTNWRRGDPNGVNEPGSAFADTIGGENLALPPIPVPTCDGNTTAINHWGQEWRVGSIASGFGRRIQTDTLQKYKGDAAHVSITSPAP